MKINSKECIFCGAQTNITREHIPPKILFSKPRPSNLITVPSCATCNASFQKDEEYFKVIITGACEDSKIEDSLLESIRKQFKHQPKLATTIQHVLIKKNGICKWNPNDFRINRVIHKIIKGLFFYEQKVVMPQNHKIYWDIVDKEFIENNTEFIKKVSRELPIHNIGNGIFQYTVKFFKTRKSFWIINFYKSIAFFVETK
jgi:hypothetical protein